MTTWGDIGSARVALADCREALPEVTGVRCLMTDPPYRVTSGGNTKPGFGGWMANDYDNCGQIVTCDLDWKDWLPLIPAALTEQAHAYIFSNDRNLPDAWRAAEATGLDFHRLLVWNKRAAMPNRWYMQCCEFVLFMKKGLAYPVNDCGAMALQSAYQRDDSEHPTEKPIGLLELYIRQSTRSGDLVLDPFMGSGSSGVAALRQGRRFVGIEIEERWFDVACKRIEQATHQSDLFCGSAAKPVAQSTLFL
jgi:DNA modification methylase